MKKFVLIIIATGLAAFANAQNTRELTTQYYPGIIHLNQPVSIAEITQVLQSTYNLGPSDALVQSTSATDELGHTHYRYEHYYKGVRVEGSDVVAHAQNGFIRSLTSSYRTFPEINTTLAMPEQSALNAALGAVKARKYAWQSGVMADIPKGQLVIFSVPRTKQTKLAYKFDIYAVEPLYRAYVFVDASSGTVLFEQNRIHHANSSVSGKSLYNGNVSFTADYMSPGYRLQQTSSGNGIQTFSLNNGTNYINSSDITSNNGSKWNDETGVQAHWGAEKTHNYYQTAHNRNSFDGNGSIIKSYVHYSNNYVNAFWDGSRMTYGDGDGINYNPLVSLDIVGHEITHGVTEYSANLVYSYESGALNESFSDIFGEAIEKHATGSNDWQMGTDIGVNGSGAIRSMSNPNQFNDPDTYLGTYWYAGSGDNGGVHVNSGVQNKWFYVLANGESGTNDIGNMYNVTGIGITAAAKIAYRNLTVYLTSNSQYLDARNGSIQAAEDLYGAGSAEAIATANAWYAVGVGGLYGTLSYCNSSSNNANYEWIASVTIGSFTNNSGSSTYSDFTNSVIVATPGQPLAVSLTPGYSGSASNEYWKIWIDYNADGDFNDVGELAFNGGLANSSLTGSINVPSSANGTTRMRISMKWNSAQSPCDQFAYGEVEDYSIQFSTGSNPTTDTQAPTAPTNITATNITTNAATINWTASTDNVGVVGYEVFVNGSSVGNTTSLTYSLANLNANTNYTVNVEASDAAGNKASGSTSFATNPVVVATSNLLGSYFESGLDNWIDGGASCSRYKGNRSYEGLYSMRIQDNSGVASSMSSASLNLQNATQVVVDFYFYASSMENGEEFVLQYLNGSTWTTVTSFVSGPDFSNNQFFHGNVILSNGTLTTFTNNAKFRFMCIASDKNDQVYIDAIQVYATQQVMFNASETPVVSITKANGKSEIIVGNIDQEDIVIYPNPARDILNIDASIEPEQVYIMSLAGQIIEIFTYEDGLQSFNISGIANGTYILAVKTEDDLTYHKFIKQ